MKKFSFFTYLLIIAIVTITMAVIYVTVQQSYRTGANDPQILLAADLSTKIQSGKSIDNIFQKDSIDITNSLSPFVALYDASGSPVKSTGYLSGNIVRLPAGVFEEARKNGQDRVTWQPRQGVRMALVVTYINSTPIQFVAAGRSLREVEDREYNLIKSIFIGWVMCVGLVLFHAGMQFYRSCQNRS